MQTPQAWVSRWLRSALAVLACVSMSACSTSWQEEVLLHDGSKIVAERSQLREGQHEIGQGPPIKESSLKFELPGSKGRVTWISEFSEDIGHANFDLLAMDIVNGTPYVVAEPSLCPSYNKWGRPNPPYIIFKYANQQWKQIPLTELPKEIKQPNVLISTFGHGDVDSAIQSGFISVETVKDLNSTLRQPEYKTILREPVKGGEGLTTCPDYSSQQYLSPRAPAPITASESGRAGPQP